MINLISEQDKKSPFTEAYRTIRTNIQFAAIGKNLKIIMFTSAGNNEGKTTTVGNLASLLAQSGQRVLIIDCDMRNPGQHKIFALPNNGLSNCLVADNVLESYVQNTTVSGVALLTSGPVAPNSSELLGSANMRSLLQQAREHYDYVLLDAPPVMPVTDAMVLSSLVDGVVLVIPSREISPALGKEVKKRLLQVGANILGVVLNRVEVCHSYGYEYYCSNNEQGKT